MLYFWVLMQRGRPALGLPSVCWPALIHVLALDCLPVVWELASSSVIDLEPASFVKQNLGFIRACRQTIQISFQMLVSQLRVR